LAALGCAGTVVGGVTHWRNRRRGRRVVVIGGGPAGATAALAMATQAPGTSILLVERDPTRLARDRDTPAFARPRGQVHLADLQRAGIDIALDEVVDIDWHARRAMAFSGRRFAFDTLLVAPGVAAREEGIEGYDTVARHRWPAAWGSDVEARRLRAQLQAMAPAGHVVLRLPGRAMTHPLGGSERALAMARFLAGAKPGARLTVLDGSVDSAARRAFRASSDPIARLVDWRGSEAGGTVRAVDAARGLIDTTAGPLAADVVNFVPAQRAGDIAVTAGLTDATGWCPCDAASRSTVQTDALVVGDAVLGARRTSKGAQLSGLRAAKAT
jgi:hypothetical protein